MIRSAIVFERQKLYDEVWSIPITQLARKYNLSDKGLAKICARMEIPCPPRGYWAKIKSGARPYKLPLAPLSAKGIARAVLNPNRQIKHPKPSDLDFPEHHEFEVREENKIIVPRIMTAPHPLIVVSEKRFKAAKIDRGKIVQPSAKRHLNIKVTSENLNRALLVMDAFLKAAEKRGYKIWLQQNAHFYSTIAAVDGEEIELCLDEKFKRTEHIPTVKEKEDYKKFGIPRVQWDYVPTGLLALRILNLYSTGIRVQWSDGQRKRIENEINGFLAGLRDAANYIKQRRLRDEQRKIEALEWEKQRHAQLQIKWAEEEKIKKLEKQLTSWNKSQEIREYAGKIIEKFPQYSHDEELKSWIEWMHRYADHLDPTVDFSIEALDMYDW